MEEFTAVVVGDIEHRSVTLRIVDGVVTIVLYKLCIYPLSVKSILIQF